MTTDDGDAVVFVDQGTFLGVQYVDVVDLDSNPWEYLVPLDRAIAEHGEQPIHANPSTIGELT